ncbi:MAG: ABC transporter ATP-binding protein [Rhizobiaceae bacterium]
MNLLEVRKLRAFYGSSQALFDVNFALEEGQVMALMGRNGMGKTTTIKAICKMLPCDGSIEFNGHDLARLPSHKIARMGIGLVPEGRRCFPNLNVEENLMAAAKSGHWNVARVTDLFPRLAERRTQSARSLSGGEQQMLAIGRALMTNPKLLILDEATEGLAPIVRQEIWKAVESLKRETGLAILLVDKSMKELRQIADKATILQRGQTVWSGNFTDLGNEITNRYLGI